MGTVYRALDTLLDRQVAVKVLSDQLTQTPTFQDRFIREAKIVARMVDPNIPQIHFIGRAEGRLFFAMEWINGQTLDRLVREEGRLSTARALDITAQVARALQVAHHAGIIHRDIKPSNVMVTPEGVVKVLDFGIARSAALQGDATKTVGFAGTPHYASPEQARGVPADARSDIYSLGATLYELLAGHPPFTGDNAMAVLTDRIVKPAPDLPEAAAVSPGVRALVARMLATQPEDRFPDAEALLEAIRAVYPTPPVRAHLGKRTMGFLTDMLLVGAPLLALFVGFWAVKGYYITTLLYDSVPGRIILGLGLFLWLSVYFVLLSRRRGATIGQRLQGIWVQKSDGSEPSLRAMATRAAVWWGPVCLAMAVQVDWPPVLVSSASGEEDYLVANFPWLIAQLWILLFSLSMMLNRRRRSLADSISRTEVVERPLLRAGQKQQPEMKRWWRRWLRMPLQGRRPLLNAGVLLICLIIVIFIGGDVRRSLPPWWNPDEIYESHMMFEKVRTGDPGWDRLVARFLHEFLGKEETALNPAVLSFQRHPFLPVLFGEMDSNLVVENMACGARLLHEGHGLWALSGYRSYAGGGGLAGGEEIEPTSDDQTRRWDEERRRIYRGSAQHFLRALMHQRLAQEGFEVLNPEAFVGLFRTGDSFILVAWPEFKVRIPGEKEPQVMMIFYRGWIHVYPLGGLGGGVGFWKWAQLPGSVLSAYAAEQDSAWGQSTDSIQQVLTLK
jgi:uncharacterized RDD family membrane protein YckC